MSFLPIKASMATRRLIAVLSLLAVAISVAAVSLPAGRADAQQVTVYMSPYCGCCGKWVGYLRQNGFTVESKLVEDVTPIRSQHGVPTRLASCHTALVDGYVIEGHVPASDIRRLLAERPPAVGLAAPGMPANAPGMEGAGQEPYEVILFDRRGATTVFARH